MAAVEEILQHPEKVKVNKARHLTEQKRMVHQHLLERQQARFEFFEPLALVRPPLFDAAAAEFAFLKAEILQLISRAAVFLVVDIVQAKRGAFHVVFNEAPLNALHTLDLSGEQPETEFRIQIFGDDLCLFAQLKYIGPAIHEQGHAVIALAGEFPDEGAVLRGDIDDFERRSRIFQNASLNQAVRTPRKLNQFNHVNYCLTKFTLVLRCKRDKRKRKK